jgi:chemotaxis protein methyltransferase CheR
VTPPASDTPAVLPAVPPRGEFELTGREFRAVAELLYRITGIHLAAGKEGLVRTRLGPRLRALSLTSVSTYLEHVDGDPAELTRMIDVLTTNKTSFFREDEHFTFLERTVLPAVAQRQTSVRLWSAGCSSGEEPFTLAIVCRETLADPIWRDTRILATDISSRVLARARMATYSQEVVADVPANLVAKHFEPPTGPKDARQYRIAAPTRAAVAFARLNLMADWPMRGPFDGIFCRNVMIYFDRQTQERLVQRFAALLRPGGFLFVGHSESLTALDHGLRYVRPAVYQR